MTRGEQRRRRARRARRQRVLLVTAVLALAAMCASFTFEKPEAVINNTVKAVQYEASEIAYKDESGESKMTAVSVGPTEPVEEDDTKEKKAEEQQSDQSETFFEEIPLDQETQSCVMKWCEEYSVRRSIALAVIQSESSFQADAQNGSCYGYMQINSINQEWLEERIGITDLKDPHQNIQAGIYILSDLYGKYGDWNKALTCYNYGEGGAYEYVFSKGETSTSYSRHVLDVAAEWAEVVGDD